MVDVRTTARGTARHSAGARAKVQAAANGYCLCTYGAAYIGGTPRQLVLAAGPLWVVPVIFTSAGYGHVGEVGIVAVDAATLQVLDATPKHEVRAAGVKLARENRDVLDAAFRRARTT
jgi:hypothetical protein